MKRKRKRIRVLAGLVCITILLAVHSYFVDSAITQAPDTIEIYVTNKKNQRMSAGNGVIYERVGDVFWIVTAAHVVREAEPERICLQQGQLSFLCEQSIVIADADLAFLKCKAADRAVSFIKKQKACRSVVRDKDSFDALQSGDEIYLYGKTQDGSVVLSGKLEETWVYVEDFAQYMLLAKAELYPGMSGCGIYDREEHFIGIACGVNHKGEIAAIPVNLVQARFEEIIFR